MQGIHKVEITQGEMGVDFFVDGVKPEFVTNLTIDIQPALLPKITYWHNERIESEGDRLSLKTERIGDREELARTKVEILATPLIVNL